MSCFSRKQQHLESVQNELEGYQNARQQELNEAVSAMDTYSYQAEVQQERISSTEDELRRTALVLQEVVAVCNQHQSELAEAVSAKEELERQVQRQESNLQEALAFIRDLLPALPSGSPQHRTSLDALKHHQVRNQCTMNIVLWRHKLLLHALRSRVLMV